MLQYAATVRLSNGQTVVYNVRASDRQSAARELALTPSRVLSVSVDWFATLMAVSVTSKGPSQTEQAIFLLNIAAQMTSGKRSTREVFDSYLSRDKRFVIDRAKYANAMNIEDFLDALGFSVNVQLLAKAGSDSGDLPTALKEAAEFLQEEEARKGAIAKRVAGGIFYSVAAVAMAIFGSMGFSSQLQEMENDIGIPFEYNLASETMFAVDWFFSTYWVFVVALLGVAFIFRREILAAADNWPVLAQINRITRIQRGINFLSLFSLLRRSGQTDPDALHYMATNSSGPDVAIYNELASVTSRGRPLNEGLRDKDWSPTILAGLGELEEMDAESAHATMKAIIGGQKQELAKAGESLATTLQLTGMISLVATILIVIIGFFAAHIVRYNDTQFIMMRKQQAGFTLIEVMVALIILSTVFAFSFQALSGVDEATKLRGMAAQAQKLANYLDRVRRAPSSIAVGSPVYPGGAPNTFTYLNLPAGSTVPDFRAAYLAEFGVAAEPTPSQSPFDTPYLITITPDIAFVETTVGFDDATIPGAEATVVAGNTTFRFYPRLNGSVRGNAQSARSAFQRNFMGEAVR